MLRLIAAAWLALIALPAAAQTFPKHDGSPVVDQAEVLRPEQELDLKSKSDALYAQTGRAFVVATVKSLEGRSIEDYGNGLLRHWKVGDEKRDDGVILLVAPNERKVRIETGYGAEGFLTDIVSGRIIRDTIVPRFKQKDIGGGIVAGADAILAQLQLPPEEAKLRAEEAAAQEKKAEFDVNPLPVIFMVIIFFVVIGSIARRAGGRRYRSRGGINPWIILWGLSELSKASRGGGGWGGGSTWGGGGWGGGGGGGGFGGFGGGSGGGGGASGSW